MFDQTSQPPNGLYLGLTRSNKSRPDPATNALAGDTTPAVFHIAATLLGSNNWYQSLEIRPVIMALVPQGVGGSSVTMAYPVLVPAKYTGWAIKVQAILDTQGL
jgi:hypothetical protein